jgi:hypothetical protein
LGIIAVVLHEEVGGAVGVEIEDHGRSKQPCHLVRLMPKVTPTKLKCLRLTIVGTGVNVLSHLNAISVAPN